jgi:hypothetical protein
MNYPRVNKGGREISARLLNDTAKMLERFEGGAFVQSKSPVMASNDTDGDLSAEVNVVALVPKDAPIDPKLMGDVVASAIKPDGVNPVAFVPLCREDDVVRATVAGVVMVDVRIDDVDDTRADAIIDETRFLESCTDGPFEIIVIGEERTLGEGEAAVVVRRAAIRIDGGGVGKFSIWNAAATAREAGDLVEIIGMCNNLGEVGPGKELTHYKIDLPSADSLSNLLVCRSAAPASKPGTGSIDGSHGGLRLRYLTADGVPVAGETVGSVTGQAYCKKGNTGFLVLGVEEGVYPVDEDDDTPAGGVVYARPFASAAAPVLWTCADTFFSLFYPDGSKQLTGGLPIWWNLANSPLPSACLHTSVDGSGAIYVCPGASSGVPLIYSASSREAEFVSKSFPANSLGRSSTFCSIVRFADGKILTVELLTSGSPFGYSWRFCSYNAEDGWAEEYVTPNSAQTWDRAAWYAPRGFYVGKYAHPVASRGAVNGTMPAEKFPYFNGTAWSLLSTIVGTSGTWQYDLTNFSAVCADGAGEVWAIGSLRRTYAGGTEYGLFRYASGAWTQADAFTAGTESVFANLYSLPDGSVMYCKFTYISGNPSGKQYRYQPKRVKPDGTIENVGAPIYSISSDSLFTRFAASAAGWSESTYGTVYVQFGTSGNIYAAWRDDPDNAGQYLRVAGTRSICMAAKADQDDDPTWAAWADVTTPSVMLSLGGGSGQAELFVA